MKVESVKGEHLQVLFGPTKHLRIPVEAEEELQSHVLEMGVVIHAK